MLLNKLIENLENVKLINNKKSIDIKTLCINSKSIEQGGLFFCLKGENFDGHNYAQEAIENGAVALVVSYKLPINVPQIVVDNPRFVMGQIASNFYGHPEKKLKLIGITGTNGKTTTTYIIKKILESSGYKVGLIGTSANYIGPIMLPPKLTTPDPLDLYELFYQMERAKCDFVVMEVSAHAIYHKKLDGLMFETMILSNITQDHLDFFTTFENYKKTKISFFNSKHTKSACFNADDPSFADAVKVCDVPYFSMSKLNKADIYATDIISTIKGNQFKLNVLGTVINVNLPLLGAFNVSNALQAVSACKQVNISDKDIENGLNEIEQVKGRFNIVETGLDFDVVIDYAHTPDGIENIVNAVNAIKTGRSILVFGCGGNRDSSKRPIMGKLASELCDFAFVTSDNPRFEKPEEIVNQIVTGITKQNYVCEPNRKLAIEKAMRFAKKNDVIIVAGKGCEDYQEINGVKYHFVDEEVVLEVAQKLKSENRESEKKVN